MTTTPGRARQVLLALAALAAFSLLAPVFPDARIRVATGAVEIGRGEPPTWKPAGEGDALGAGDRVRTGEDGRAEIAQGGSTLRLYPNSMLRLPGAAPDAAAVELERGSSLFDVLRRGEGEPFEVRTPEVVVSVKGTRFGVALGADDAASVAVFRGLVGVRNAELEAAPETLVQAGFAAFGSDHFELSWHGADDPWESWSGGGAEPDSLERRAPRRDAALRDAREAALELARELPQRPARGGDDRKLQPDVAELAPPAARDELKAGEPTVGSARDVVADAEGALEETLEESYVEKLLNSDSGGSGGGLPLLTIDYLSSSGRSGSDVVVLGDGVNTWSFEEDEVEALREGSLALPADLAPLVQARGWSDADFANQLLPLFD